LVGLIVRINLDWSWGFCYLVFWWLRNCGRKLNKKKWYDLVVDFWFYGLVYFYWIIFFDKNVDKLRLYFRVYKI